MIIVKPLWVDHEGMNGLESVHVFLNEMLLLLLCCTSDKKPIFSIDIHPKGGRFATGGQGGSGGRVVIWNLAPVLSEEDDNSNVPKMLCQMDNHLGN